MSVCSDAWDLEGASDIALSMEVRAAWIKTQTLDAQETAEHLYFTSAWVFIYPPVSQGEGHSPVQRWGGAARHQQG